MLRALTLATTLLTVATSSAQMESDSTAADASAVGYELSCVFAYGGESKLAVLFPRVQLVRKHNLGRVEPYYGVGAGLQAALITYWASAGVLGGVTIGSTEIEVGLGRWYTPPLRVDGPTPPRPSLRQDLLSLRGGVAIGRVHLRVGHAWEIARRAPADTPPAIRLGIGKSGLTSIEVGVDLQEL